MKIVDQLELARQLGVSDRRIRQLENEQVIERLDDEPVRYDLDASARRYRMYADADLDSICRNIDEAINDIDTMFKCMREESDIQNRRQIAAREGDAIGRLDVAMKLANALMPEHARQLGRTHANLIVGRAASDCFELCNWRLETRSEEVASANAI